MLKFVNSHPFITKPKGNFQDVCACSRLYLLWMKVNVQSNMKGVWLVCVHLFFLLVSDSFCLFVSTPHRQRLSCIFMGAALLLKNSLLIFNMIVFSKGKITHKINEILKTEPITAQTRVLEKRMLTFSTRCVPTIDIFQICICIQLGCIVVNSHTHTSSRRWVWPLLITVYGLPINFEWSFLHHSEASLFLTPLY